jgi:hypothetical protein
VAYLTGLARGWSVDLHSGDGTSPPSAAITERPSRRHAVGRDHRGGLSLVGSRLLEDACGLKAKQSSTGVGRRLGLCTVRSL